MRAEVLLGFVTRQVWVCICNMLVCLCFFFVAKKVKTMRFFSGTLRLVFFGFCVSVLGSLNGLFNE